MALLQNDFAKGVKPMPVPNGSEVVAIRLEYNLAAALVLNDIIELGQLPEDCVPVDCILDADDLDTGGAPAITLSVGALNAAKNDLDVTELNGGAAWIVASNIGQAGGIARPTTTTLSRVQPSATTRRSVGIKIAAGPQVGAAAGKVGLTFLYRAAMYGA